MPAIQIHDLLLRTKKITVGQFCSFVESSTHLTVCQAINNKFSVY